jgi:chromosome segregation ATPase
MNELEIETMEERRQALSEELAQAETELNARREDLLAGRPKATNSVTVLQSRTLALAEAIKALDRRLQDKKAALTAAREQETRAAQVARLVELARSADAALRDLEAAREEANERLKAPLERALAALAQATEARREFINLAAQLAPGITIAQDDFTRRREEPHLGEAVGALMRELESAGAALSAVKAPLVGTRRTAIDSEYDVPPLLPYGRAVTVAFQQASERRALAAKAA